MYTATYIIGQYCRYQQYTCLPTTAMTFQHDIWFVSASMCRNSCTSVYGFRCTRICTSSFHYKNDLWPRRTSGTRRHPRHRDYAHRHGRPCPRYSAKRETSWKIFLPAEPVTHLSDVIRQCVYSRLQGTRVSPVHSCRSIAFPATKMNDIKAEA